MHFLNGCDDFDDIYLNYGYPFGCIDKASVVKWKINIDNMVIDRASGDIYYSNSFYIGSMFYILIKKHINPVQGNN